jgi:FSR family fosmidomycin resistance protein-like MFS transporter
MKYRQVGILSAGHLVTDINQGALPAMLPFFIAAYDLSYAAAAGIVFAANMTSSIVQPVFGHAADRFSKPWLLPVGLLMAGIGLAFTGIFQGYGWILSMAIVSGIGIAAYHPEAARRVNFAAGNKKGTAMSLFGVGGTIGFAVGPLIATAALLHWGLKGTLVLIVPVTIMAAVMASQFSLFTSLDASRNGGRSKSDVKHVKDNWSAFSRLTITIIGRSILFYGLNTFIPIYWINGLNQSKVTGAMALTIFAGSGIVGNLVGGSFADRMGQKKVMITGYIGLTLFLPLLILTNSAHVAMLLLVPIGLLLYGTYSPSIVLGQMYLPNRVGFSSGITLGVAVAIGGGAAPIIGKIADVFGIWHALASIACFPILILLAALSLPNPQKGNVIDPMKTIKVVKNESA